MDFLRLLAFGYLLYGIVGLFGFQKIPEAHRDRPWTKSYIRWQAVSWILAAQLCCVLFFVRAVYRFFGETDRASFVVVCADHLI